MPQCLIKKDDIGMCSKRSFLKWVQFQTHHCNVVNSWDSLYEPTSTESRYVWFGTSSKRSGILSKSNLPLMPFRHSVPRQLSLLLHMRRYNVQFLSSVSASGHFTFTRTALLSGVTSRKIPVIYRKHWYYLYVQLDKQESDMCNVTKI